VADSSNGYEAIAQNFIAARTRSSVGTATVRDWSRALRRSASILDIGCGSGVPIAQMLVEGGFEVFGLDASPSMVAAFRQRFPKSFAKCEAAEESDFFGRRFDAIICVGLIFLLPAETQRILIAKVSGALKHGGRFLFTSPKQACTWSDVMTGRLSFSLGSEEYHRILATHELELVGEGEDEGENHYYFAKSR
jgi:2-polyprenyl-3-methyl-5-hydroxy-6-metoxy-1,4-benzoquinol methylase